MTNGYPERNDVITSTTRVIEYLLEYQEVHPDLPEPTAVEIRDALDCAHDPITLEQVEYVLAAS